MMFSRFAHRNSAFTLIELLIVVAIIAILAAIAVPNFLEAHTRAKVSKAKSDMRVVATGLEAYHVDYSNYPPNPDVNEGFNVTPPQLTTPVAYLTSRPIDPFKTHHNLALKYHPTQESEGRFYDYYTIITEDEYQEQRDRGNLLFILVVNDNRVTPLWANQGAFKKYGRWLQWSSGPDLDVIRIDEDFRNPNQPSQGLGIPRYGPWGYSFDVPYDPSNGTVSWGNIIRSEIEGDGLRPLID